MSIKRVGEFTLNEMAYICKSHLEKGVEGCYDCPFFPVALCMVSIFNDNVVKNCGYEKYLDEMVELNDEEESEHFIRLCSLYPR